MSEIKAVYFPRLHAGLTDGLPEGVGFLDPGLEDVPGPDVLRPDSLPVPPAEAKAYLAQALNFGEMFKSKGEIAHYGVAGLEDFYTGTTMSVVSDLADMDKGVRPDEGLARRRKAQALLILSVALETRILEIKSLDAKLKEGLASFTANVGLDGDDEGLPGLSLASVAEAAVPVGAESFDELRLPWKLVLEAYFELLEPTVPLLTDDPDLVEYWRDEDLPFAAAEGIFPQAAPGRIMAVRAPAWKLLGRKRQPTPSEPAWLTGERTMYCLLRV